MLLECSNLSAIFFFVHSVCKQNAMKLRRTLFNIHWAMFTDATDVSKLLFYDWLILRIRAKLQAKDYLWSCRITEFLISHWTELVCFMLFVRNVFSFLIIYRYSTNATYIFGYFSSPILLSYVYIVALNFSFSAKNFNVFLLSQIHQRNSPVERCKTNVCTGTQFAMQSTQRHFVLSFVGSVFLFRLREIRNCNPSHLNVENFY